MIIILTRDYRDSQTGQLHPAGSRLEVTDERRRQLIAEGVTHEALVDPTPRAQPLTYEESAALMNDLVFRGRVKVAGLHYADYVMNEAPSAPAHNARVRWATQMFQMPEQQAILLQPPTVMDASVQSAGAAVTDAALQSAVEGVVNKLI